jgi:uncharacterized membrane protein YcaP (DUF421 family)
MPVFNLAMPWWHFVLRALIVYVVLLVMVRLSGKRSVGQFTPFDMILLILLGNAVQNALLGEDTSVGGGLLLAGTLISFNYVVGQLAARFPGFHAFVEGKPVRLIEEGRVDTSRLRQEAVSRADIDEALRRNGLEHCDQVHVAWLENDGSITIIPRDKKD